MKIKEILEDSENLESRDFENPLPSDTNSNAIWDKSDIILEELIKQYREKNNISFSNPDDRDIIKKTYAAVNHQYGKVTNVPINKILATESHLVKSHIEALVNGETNSNELPVIYKMGNTYMVADGNHRVTAEYLKNKKEVKALVLDLDDLGKQLNIT